MLDYETMEKNVYLCDAAFDAKGNPICLYVISDGHEPGPKNGPREWRVLFWNGKAWDDRKVCDSDHNYDMGSIFVSGNTWRVVAPTDAGPQPHGSGGEIVMWESRDSGLTWKKKKAVTESSARNHNYVRRVVNGKSPFMYLWADGNPNAFSPSYLYIGDDRGNVAQLPYEMDDPEQTLTVERKR